MFFYIFLYFYYFLKKFIKKLMKKLAKNLPSSLSNPLPLQTIAKIEYHYKLHKPGFPQTRSFIKTYIPPMRFYNEDFIYVSISSAELKTPKFVLYDKKQEKIGEIIPVSLQPDQILEKIISFDKGKSPIEDEKARNKVENDEKNI